MSCQDGPTSSEATSNAAELANRGVEAVAGGSSMSVNLYPWIHHAHCSVTNGELPPVASGSGSRSSSTSLSSIILRPHDQRNERDADKSLTVVDDGSGFLVTVAFSELVRVKQVLITSATGEERIERCKVWSNRIDPPDLEEAEENDPKPDQDFALLQGERGCVEYPLRVARFASVSTVTVYLSSSRPAPQRLFYLGFKGESHAHKKESGDDIAVGAHNTAPATVPGLKEKYGSAHQIIR